MQRTGRAAVAPVLDLVEPDGAEDPWHARTRFEAEYELETPARCGSCDATLSRVAVVRLMRVRVNFTSILPRRGYLVVCPSCRSVLPAALRSVV